MVVIRLARHGSKHKPFYHVTVADRRARRDGAFIERIGFYNPIPRGQSERVRIDFERLEYWQGVGAQTSATVKRLIREARRLPVVKSMDDSADAEAAQAETAVDTAKEANQTTAVENAESAVSEAETTAAQASEEAVAARSTASETELATETGKSAPEADSSNDETSTSSDQESSNKKE